MEKPNSEFVRMFRANELIVVDGIDTALTHRCDDGCQEPQSALQDKCVFDGNECNQAGYDLENVFIAALCSTVAKIKLLPSNRSMRRKMYRQ